MQMEIRLRKRVETITTILLSKNISAPPEERWKAEIEGCNHLTLFRTTWQEARDAMISILTQDGAVPSREEYQVAIKTHILPASMFSDNKPVMGPPPNKGVAWHQ